MNSIVEEFLPVFTEEMKFKIESRESSYGDFTQYSTADLLYHFGQEVKELSVALASGPSNSDSIAKEAVDVANLAFMLWWFHKANP